MLDGRLLCGGLAGTQLPVNFQKGVVAVLCGVLAVQGGHDGILIAEKLQHVGIGAHAVGQGAAVIVLDLLHGHIVPNPQQRTDEHRHRDLAVLVDADVENVAGIGLILQPGAPVGDDRGLEELLAGLVEGLIIIYAGRTNQLGNDDPFRTVDDKGAALGHQREIAHEDFLLVDLAGLLIEKPGPDVKGCVIGYVPDLAFGHRIFRGLVQPVIDKIQNEISGVVRDGGNIAEYFLQPLLQEPFVRIDLHLDQVRHIQHFSDTRKAHSSVLPELHRLDIHHRLNHSIHLFRERKAQAPPPSGIKISRRTENLLLITLFSHISLCNKYNFITKVN